MAEGPHRIQKSHVGLTVGSAVTALYLVSALGFGPLRITAATAVVGVPLLTVATFLVTLIWMLEEEAFGLARDRPEARPLGNQARVLALASLVYFSVFFGLWSILDHLDPSIGWHHFALIVLFIVWQLTLAAYGYALKRRLAALGGVPLWWWKPVAPAPEPSAVAWEE